MSFIRENLMSDSWIDSGFLPDDLLFDFESSSLTFTSYRTIIVLYFRKKPQNFLDFINHFALLTNFKLIFFTKYQK